MARGVHPPGAWPRKPRSSSWRPSCCGRRSTRSRARRWSGGSCTFSTSGAAPSARRAASRRAPSAARPKRPAGPGRAVHAGRRRHVSIGPGRAGQRRARPLPGLHGQLPGAQQTCHPWDTLAWVLAASEVCALSGREFLTCLAVAYQVFCKLAWEAPVQWQREPLDVILRCSLKSHNAEVHTQPVLETVLRLRQEHGLDRRLDDIERVELEVFKQAYDITGSGEEAGNKYDVRTKEQADHSLPYPTALALRDGEVTPHQFTSDRIQAADVQGLLEKVRTLRDDQFTVRYPNETPCRVMVEFGTGGRWPRKPTTGSGSLPARCRPNRCATSTRRSPPTTSTRAPARDCRHEARPGERADQGPDGAPRASRS